MVSLGQELSDQGGVVILTDPEGIVLGRQGDHAFAVEADRLGLSEGIDWSEQAIGTNAIGTTALERTALTIVGAEHLFCLNTSISCSAVPILDPCGALAGVLDVSTSLSVPHDHLLLLLKRSVLEIERRLFEQRFPRHVKLRFHSSEHLLGGIRDGLLAFDDDRLVGPTVRRLNSSGRIGRVVGSVRFEELFATDYDTLTARRLRAEAICSRPTVVSSSLVFSSRRRRCPASGCKGRLPRAPARRVNALSARIWHLRRCQTGSPCASAR